MASPHFGHAFGLAFSSPRPLPELGSQSNTGNTTLIEISWGPVATQLENKTGEFGLIQVNQHSVLLTIPNVARYLIQADCITIDADTAADESTVRLFLFGTAIGALLHLRRFMVLHASAVRLPDGGAAVFAGVSTAGKSTLAAALALHGFAPLADDITAIQFDEHGIPWVYPGLARSKLWGNSFEKLGLDANQCTTLKVKPDIDKYLLNQDHGTEPARMTHFYELSVNANQAPSITPILGGQRVLRLLENTYRARIIKLLGLHADQAQQLVKLAACIHSATLTRPATGNSLNTLIDLLGKDWQ